MQSRDTTPGVSFGPVDGREEARIHAVIVYNNVAAARRAVEVLSRVVRGAAGDLDFVPRAWRGDHLQDQKWFELALVDARQADLLVLAGNTSVLDEPVRAWVRAAFAEKRGSGAAAVAFLENDGPEGRSESGALRFVQNAAEEAGLNFFVPQGDAAGETAVAV